MCVVGYLLGPRPAWLECDRPLRVVCRGCDYETRWACSGHRASRCKPCAARYRRRVGRVAESGTKRTTGYQYLLTLTAPGKERHKLPDGSWCPCTPAGGVDLARWNASHSARWNVVRGALRRDHPSLEFFRGVEVQGRGALHDHAMVWSETPLRRAEVRAVAMRAGFGHSVDVAPAPPGSKRAAYYVSKYVTKAADSRRDVPWWGETVDHETGEVSEGVVAGRYRTWSMSRQWGSTMSMVRREARDWINARNAELEFATAHPDGLQLELLPGPDESPPPPS